ncbi:hypothetical protein PPSIR1_01467 [Plesiocystis pacifica SIR-1]|uniref:Cytochrome P450 n=1 Tax=Plesiocystis pacifica SIR-1 TaxID=391625 RepID=A6G8E4_9BACT|nr:hypothetical protein [Plesiocystis pacifica]EDM77854.1 hypothetical protein PPSIR1_01467 [Plesiocystis pacifica SIR-1]
MGPHTCLGAHLARLETRSALATSLRRCPGLALVDEGFEWSPSIFHVPERLRLRI